MLGPARPPRVVVVGGGLAGCAAAVALGSAGVDVTLVEARKSLGGRASSFEDPQTGEVLDNCQHVLLGCCTNLLDFYRRLGVEGRVRFEAGVPFYDERGRRFELRATPGLPAPLHLGWSFATFGALTLGERVAAARGMTAMLRLGRAGRGRLADVPFGQWLDGQRQPAALVTKLYDPVLIGSLNERTRDASAAYAVQVFQDAMLAHADGYVIGVPACPLAQLYERLPCRDVRLGARVAELTFASPTSVTGVTLTSGEVLAADAVVLATNHHGVRRWVPDDAAAGDARFAHLDKLQSVPILGVHLWFDRPVLAEPFAALLSGPLQWVFRKDASGAAVHGVISAAREWVDVDRGAAMKQFERQLKSTLPLARDAALVRGTIVVEKRATFSPLPGVDRLRPTQAPPPGGIDNLYLAGDYTRTGWPATMEGAVRSGYLAAEAVLVGVTAGGAAGRRFVVEDLAVQWPARLMGL
ncbi:MAG TPA: hydroxysqualene dehydroxylase HpnE [Tepidisphaeraceae bacterium]|nr:hydroxysqualene dehydroxylase HpnE [Tepidisphaeraceae bacterium]